MKEKLKTYKLVGIPTNQNERLVLVGKLKMKGQAHDAYYSMGKHFYWVKRGLKV
tara:strand:- start:408 stop:569 length:162 start_codon:yes stop_codon:yes gene_type:complete